MNWFRAELDGREGLIPSNYIGNQLTGGYFLYKGVYFLENSFPFENPILQKLNIFAKLGKMIFWVKSMYCRKRKNLLFDVQIFILLPPDL